MQFERMQTERGNPPVGPVEAWFGQSFIRLHPMLQSLHRRGGSLHGQVHVSFGVGLAGWLGRRLARKIGVPSRTGDYRFQVEITHSDGTLHWARCFDEGHRMVSVFVPTGAYPTGSWTEKTGNIALVLGVDADDGGWTWVQRAVSLRGVHLPSWFAPRTTAYKRIVDGRYEFSVKLRLPFLGELFAYGGMLSGKSVDCEGDQG
ncbi:MAG: DUF4166 domain-containing protein [Pseudomonadota bacterium]|jgi:hypothetical protein